MNKENVEKCAKEFVIYIEKGLNPIEIHKALEVRYTEEELGAACAQLLADKDSLDLKPIENPVLSENVGECKELLHTYFKMGLKPVDAGIGCRHFFTEETIQKATVEIAEAAKTFREKRIKIIEKIEGLVKKIESTQEKGKKRTKLLEKYYRLCEKLNKMHNESQNPS